MWGTTIAEKPVLVNNVEFSITDNLYLILKQFRTASGSACIWVDAICVNQTDLIERGEQVQIMHRIYKEAFDTMIWLGPSTDDSHLAFELIELFCDVHAECDDFHRRTGVWDLTRWGTRESWDIERHMEALVELLERPWFYRVWVIQEVVMSSKIAISCGGQMTTWDKVSTLVRRNKAYNHSLSTWACFSTVLATCSTVIQYGLASLESWQSMDFGQHIG